MNIIRIIKRKIIKIIKNNCILLEKNKDKNFNLIKLTEKYDDSVLKDFKITTRLEQLSVRSTKVLFYSYRWRKKENHLLRSGIILITCIKHDIYRDSKTSFVNMLLSSTKHFSKTHWKKISYFMKVNGFIRTWFECKYHWILYLSKKICSSIKWTFSEDVYLINRIENCKQNSWIQIAKEIRKGKITLIDIDVKNKKRSKGWKKVKIFTENNLVFLVSELLVESLPNCFEVLKFISRQCSTISCFRRYTSLQKEHYKLRWYRSKDEKLRKAIWRYGQDWITVSQKIEKMTPSECKSRWYRSMTVHLGEKSQLNWTIELDLCLILTQIFYFKVDRSIRDFHLWSQVQKHFRSFLPNQLNEHYLLHLSPKAVKKHFWSPKEREIVLNLTKNYCTLKWTLVAKLLGTQHLTKDVREQWNLTKHGTKRGKSFKYKKI